MHGAGALPEDPQIRELQVMPAPAASAGCDPTYTGAYVPVVDDDFNCPDIDASVVVVGVDIHHFDREGDGLGCESN